MRKRVGIIVWILFLIALPFQVRTIIGEWNGEWFSFFLYATDAVTVALLVLTPGWWGTMKRMPGRWFLVALLSLGALSIVGASDWGLGLFRFFFLVKGVVLLGVAGVWFKHAPVLSFAALGISAVVQAIMGLGQFIVQGDLGLHILGESTLSTLLPGVAKIVSAGVVYVRVYGATPHPNVLGAVLLAGVLAGWAICPNIWRSKRGRNVGLVFLGALLVFVLLLTFSRLLLISLVGAIVLLFFWVLTEKKRDRLFSLQSLGVLALMLVVLLWALWPFWSERIIPSPGEQSVSLRAFYVTESVDVIKEHPWLGVGPGGGVGALQDRVHSLEPWVLQPVHSMYLVIASEIGLLGLLSFMLFLLSLFSFLASYRSYFG